MSKMKLLVATVLMAACTSASAQFANSKGSGIASTTDTNGWNTVWVQYNPGSWNYDVKGVDDITFNSFSLGYSRAFSVTNRLPLFVEAGAGLQYYWSSEDTDIEDGTVTAKTHMLSVKVPVDLLYRFQLSNSSIAIMPYAGLNLRYNMSGKAKYEYSESDDDDFFNAPSLASSGFDADDDEDESDESDLFDKKDMGSDGVWKHFQIGWHVGVKAQFGKNFMAGVGYGSDFSELAKKMKSGEWTIQLGYTF